MLISALLVTIFERSANGSIQGFGDALWWAATTVTTVGYGDKYPLTAEGRAVAVFLMIVGIAIFGVLTAGIAAYFVESESEKDVSNRELLTKIEALHLRLDEQSRVLSRLTSHATEQHPGDPH